MTDYIFIGPSLPPDEVLALLPGAELLPPIRHGDLLRVAPRRGDRVLVVDGLFMQSAPVRHRELLAALDAGAVVAGSSSMGALRAAELWQYGMRGVGTVFELYRDGVVTGDDEVAVVYGPAEDGFPLLSKPLIDLRLSLAAAADDGVLTRAQSAALLQRAARLPFRGRSPTALRLACADVRDGSVQRFHDWAAGHRVDTKADDARRLLRAACAGELEPHGSRDRPIRNLSTYLFERWEARHVGATVGGRFVSDAEAVAVVRVLHPDLARLHRRDVLRELTGSHDTEAVVALATQRGIVDAAGVDQVAARQYLTPAEQGSDAAEAVTRLVVRALGPSLHPALSRTRLPAEVRGRETLDVARHFARKAMAVNDRLPRPDVRRPERRMFFRADAVDEILAAAWAVPPGELEAVARDRGFADLVALRAVAEPLAALVKLAGAPAFPQACAEDAQRVRTESVAARRRLRSTADAGKPPTLRV